MKERIQALIAKFPVKALLSVGAEGWRNYRRALSLLTRLPVAVEWDPQQPWGKLAGWFPAAGLAVGLILMLLAWGWDKVADPSLVGSALVLVVWVGVTGGLHLDGLSDCADAFFTPVSREKRLEIMADPRLGAFGTMGLVLALLLKFGGIMHILTFLMGASGFWWQMSALWPLVVAPVAARAAMVGILSMGWIPLAKAGGMGAMARDGLGKGHVIGALALAVVVALLGGWRGVAMLLAALAAGAATASLAWRRIGGLTGDVLGAVVETGEIAALMAATMSF